MAREHLRRIEDRCRGHLLAFAEDVLYDADRVVPSLGENAYTRILARLEAKNTSRFVPAIPSYSSVTLT